MAFPSYIGSYGGVRASVKPLWTQEFEDDDIFLEWVKDVIGSIKDEHQERTERDLRSRDFYLGIQSLSLGREGIPRDREGRPIDRFARVTINQSYELVEQWVSKMTRFAPAIAVIPPNTEYNDRIAARLSKEFIDYLFYQNDIDDMLEEVARLSRIEAEAYVVVDWDRSIGDYSPDYQTSQNLGLRIPLIGSDGRQILSDEREPLWIEKGPRVGDVRYRLFPRRHVILQPKTRWKEVEWVIIVTTQDIDELKAQYPEEATGLDLKTSGNGFSLDLFEAEGEWNETLVYELYHKSTEFLDSGRYVKFTDGAVLESTSLKDKVGHQELPVARLSNIDIPGMLHAQSLVEQLMLLQVMFNNLSSIAYTNLALGSHLYWLVPAQANVDISKLRNSSSVIKYNAGMPPQIQQFKTVGGELFQALEFVSQWIQRISGIQGVSRGEVPPGIEAGVALAFLEEQENQRANTDIKKHNAFIKKLARLSLATAGAFYSEGDGRTLRVVGKNNQFSIKALDIAKLGGPYDIRVQRTTALSESKSGRLSQILALEGRFPGKMPWEQVTDMLDLANDQKFYSLATVAVQAAERENELMAEGIPAAPSVDHEEHIVHWFSHVKYMNSASYKEDLPPERKKFFELHVLGTETLMHMKARVNPTFQTRLLELENFPIFLDIASIQAALAPAGPPPGGEAPLPPGPPPEEIGPEPTSSGESPLPGMEPLPPAPPAPGEQPDAQLLG